MLKPILLVCIVVLASTTAASAQRGFAVDTIQTTGGPLKITFIGHSSLMFSFNHKIIHIDPFSRVADYSKLPKADLILITHEHGDHLDPGAIAAVRGKETVVVCAEACVQTLPSSIVMKNGDTKTILGLQIQAVPAYNLIHKRENGQPFHAKGIGNGYIITFGSQRVYIAGDTENTPEMKALKNIDIAFLPMNLPYTMTPEMVADAARAFKPKILYPYHTGETDPEELVDLLDDEPNIDVRIRKMP